MKKNILIGILVGMALVGCGASIPMTNCTGSSTPWYEYNIAATGGDQPHNILQPYITVYMYKRVS